MFDPEAKTLRAVDDVSLTVRKGETLGLVGESGCGKSTLARMIVRLLRPTAGEIFLEGNALWQGDSSFIKSLPKRMQMVFQDPVSSLNPRKQVGNSIREALDIHGVGSKTERKQQVYDLLGLVGLRPEHYTRYPHEFSGGQRQRIAIARALVLNPDLVVCDEPVSALDVSVQAQVLNLFKSLQKRLDLTYVFISHDLAVMGHISDRIAVMYLGKIVEMAPAKELFATPKHPYTRALLEAIPIPDPDAKRQETHVPLSGDIPSPLNPPSGCPFHTRCPQVMDICRTTMPEWIQPDGTDTAAPAQEASQHGVLCHLYAKRQDAI